jgi:hypothetical protein
MNFHRFWIGERMGVWEWIGAGYILAGILMAEAVKRAQGKEQGAKSKEHRALLLAPHYLPFFGGGGLETNTSPRARRLVRAPRIKARR